MRLSSTRAYYRPSPPKMPPGLVELMEGLTKEVLKQSPADVYGFCASHMQQLLEKRDGPLPKKSLSLEEKVAKAQEKVRERAKIRREEYDKALLLQQNSNAADKDDKQGLTLQVPQLVVAQIPLNVSTDFDKDTVKETIPNKPIHHELERSAEMEISHDLESAITKPITTVIAAESSEEEPMKKDDVKESTADAEIVNVDNSKKGEGLVAKESGSESYNTLRNVSPNVNPETENKQTLESVDMIASNVTSESTTVIDKLKENADQQIKEVDLKDSSNAEYTASLDKDKGLVIITPEISAVENLVEVTKSLNNDDINLINSNVSDGFEIETSGKTEDIQESNNIQQSPEKSKEQIQQSTIPDVILTKESIDASSVTDVQQSGTTPNPQTDSTNDKLNTGSSEEIKLPNTITLKIGDSDNSDIQPGNNPNTVQEVNFNNTQIKSDEKVQELNEVPSIEISKIKIDNVQPLINSESNKLSNANTDLLQESDNSDSQLGNNSDMGNMQIKTHEKAQQLNNKPSTEVSNLKLDDPQLSENRESNIPKDVEKLDSIEKLTKPVEETKITVVSAPESRTELPITGVDRDVPTMMTENFANNEDNGLKSESSVNKEIQEHDDKDIVASGKVISDAHMHQIVKANSSDSNADFSIPSHSTEDDDTSHDEANMSDKAQKDNQDTSTMDLETAAITIQKVFRNFLFKSRGSTFEDSANDEGNFLDDDDKNKDECEFPIASALNIDRRAHGITRMDTVLQTVNEEKSLSLSTDDSSTLSSAATIIQAHVRGFLVRNKLNSNKTISTNSLAASNSNEPSITSLEADNDHNKKTILNIHIVPEGENCYSRDESLITSMDLSLDSSPPSSINLHPLGYDKSERRKQLKREDAIQSISPPSNNSGKLSEDLDSVKELSLNDRDIVGEQLDEHDNNIIKDELLKENRMISPIQNGSLETDVKTNDNNITNHIDDSETRLRQKRKSLTKMSSDEMDVVTPFVSNEDLTSSILIHSGEFHDAVLPTRVSRNDTSVVSGE